MADTRSSWSRTTTAEMDTLRRNSDALLRQSATMTATAAAVLTATGGDFQRTAWYLRRGCPATRGESDIEAGAAVATALTALHRTRSALTGVPPVDAAELTDPVPDIPGRLASSVGTVIPVYRELASSIIGGFSADLDDETRSDVVKHVSSWMARWVAEYTPLPDDMDLWMLLAVAHTELAALSGVPEIID